MRFQPNFRSSAAALALLVAAGATQPALAQATTAASVSVGAKVSDQAGGDVGTIASIEGENVVLKTDKHEILLPAASLAKTATGFIVGMTRDQLNAQMDQAIAEAQALVTVGATVHDTAGGTVGTIKALDAEFATLALAGGEVKLPRASVAATPTGPVVGITAAELEAQLAAAK